MTGSPKIRIGILGSTRGSTLRPLVDHWRNGSLDVEFVVVISDRRKAAILDYAREIGMEAVAISAKGLEREAFDARVTAELQKQKVDLVLMIGYLRIVSAPFVRQWRGRLLNIHPSLLPKHGGLMDLEVHRSVLRAGDPESGCTLHLAEEEVDGGRIILQKRCPVLPEDTPESLKERVQTLEAETFIELLRNPRKHLETLRNE